VAIYGIGILIDFGTAGELNILTRQRKVNALSSYFSHLRCVHCFAPAVFCTFGEQGAALLNGAEFVLEPALPVQIVDRIGSGDAFAAGVLDGWLSGGASALREGLRGGVALAAIALSQFGDRVLSSRAELNAMLASERHDISR